MKVQGSQSFAGSRSASNSYETPMKLYETWKTCRVFPSRNSPSGEWWGRWYQLRIQVLQGLQRWRRGRWKTLLERLPRGLRKRDSDGVVFYRTTCHRRHIIYHLENVDNPDSGVHVVLFEDKFTIQRISTLWDKGQILRVFSMWALEESGCFAASLWTMWHKKERLKTL